MTRPKTAPRKGWSDGGFVPDDDLSPECRKILAARLGSEVIAEIASTVALLRRTVQYPTLDEQLAALEPVEKAVRQLREALASLDEATTDALDAHAYARRARRPPLSPNGVRAGVLGADAVARLKAELEVWPDVLAAAVRQTRRRKEAAESIPQMRVWGELKRIFEAHGIRIGRGDKAKVAVVLGAVLDDLGLPGGKHPGNYTGHRRG